MFHEFRPVSVNYAPSTPSDAAGCGRPLPLHCSVPVRCKFHLSWVPQAQPWLRTSFISDACRRRFESALLADSTVVEFDAEVFGDVLDVNDEFGALFALFNTARNVPVEVEVNIK